jgi:hypothetical protein
MFNSKPERKVPTFKNRAEAFNYMFAELYENGADPINAAERANSFADIVSTNLGLPNEPEKPKSVVEKTITIVKQVAVIKKDYPEVWDLVVGAIGGVVGAVVGVKASQPEEPEEERSPLDFDNMEGV